MQPDPVDHDRQATLVSLDQFAEIHEDHPFPQPSGTEQHDGSQQGGHRAGQSGLG